MMKLSVPPNIKTEVANDTKKKTESKETKTSSSKINYLCPYIITAKLSLSNPKIMLSFLLT